MHNVVKLTARVEP